jgi:glycosyltransferase involved in cell wall biosynthesis
MKVLFISSRDARIKSHGGFQCTNRNYLSCCEIFGTDQVEVIDLSLGVDRNLLVRMSKWGNYGRGFVQGVSGRRIKKIINKAKEKDFVFIDSSQLGVIAYRLKRKNYHGKIISFFHNVEYNIRHDRLKTNPLLFWRSMISYYNEQKAIKYSDRLVTLNKRDGAELKRIYKLDNVDIMVIPISFKDEFEKAEAPPKEFTSIPPTLLFIGNLWYPNIHGILWFIKNVLDHVNIKLQIVGMGLDAIKDKFVHPKIEFLGYVKDLKPVMRNADYMISPIFKGSGMKVKTCEALMYGKNIIGTQEAFEGYEVDYTKIGAVCNTKEEFINTINEFSTLHREKFNQYSRESFLNKYSFAATLKKFDELFSKRETKN